MGTEPRKTWTEQERDAYLRGIEFFNAKDFFEAHEVWENAWNDAIGARRDFYQGLIQMAVALVHLQRGNRLGAEKVFERALVRWAHLPEMCMGLNRMEFEQRMRELLAGVLGALPGTPVRFEPSRFFHIRLEYDPFGKNLENGNC